MKKHMQQLSKTFTYSGKEIELIKQTIAQGATDIELQLFLYQCQRTGLDALSRQIYFVKRAGKATIQTSIDGLRVIAERSKDYAGQDEPVFEEASPYPIKCKVTVYRFDKNGNRYPAAHGVAYWSEYYPGDGAPGFMWRKMPHTMLAKVAEALALRKAFPQDLSGLYAPEEMEQAKDIQTETLQGQLTEPIKKHLITSFQMKKIFALINDLGAKPDDGKEFIKKFYNVDSLKDLEINQASAYIKALEKRLEKKQGQKPLNEDVDPDEAIKNIDDPTEKW